MFIIEEVVFLNNNNQNKTSLAYCSFVENIVCNMVGGGMERESLAWQNV
jgi:hypothetical protein